MIKPLTDKVLSFGLDYLACELEAKDNGIYDYLFEGLSMNSDYRDTVFYGLKVRSYYIDSSMPVVHLFYMGENIAQIKKIVDRGISTKVSYRVDFYGTAFLLLKPKFFRNFLKSAVIKKKIVRCDIKIDLLCSVDDVMNKGYISKNSFYSEMKTNDRLETVYLGKKSHKNKRSFIRIYDKKLDIYSKGKIGLLGDYMSYDEVSRIEIQMNSIACRESFYGGVDFFEDDFDFSVVPDITKNSVLWEIFVFHVLNEKRTFLNYLGNLNYNPSTGFEYFRHVKASSLEGSSNYYKIRMFKAYYRSLFELGYNMVLVCFQENIKNKIQKVLTVDV